MTKLWTSMPSSKGKHPSALLSWALLFVPVLWFPRTFPSFEAAGIGGLVLPLAMLGASARLGQDQDQKAPEERPEQKLSVEERRRLSELKSQLKARDAQQRTAALHQIAAMSSTEERPAKEIAEAMVRALKDKDWGVATTAAGLLDARQHSAVAVKALRQVLRNSEKTSKAWEKKARKQSGGRATDGGEEKSALALYFRAVAVALATHADRDALETLLHHARLPSEKVRWSVLEAVHRGLAQRKSKAGCVAAIALLEELRGRRVEETSKSRRQRVHQILCEYTKMPGAEGSPGISENGLVEAWRGWFDRNHERLNEN